MSFGDSSRTGFAALDLDLPLERTSERNIYRRRLVELTQARRAFEQQRDEVVLEVTNRWRDFDRALSSYEIQKRSVALAQKRVESTELLLNAGRAIMRDVLDAREDLLDAQNRASQALVDLRVSTLELERDMDILVVDENGQLQEGAGYNDIQD
jgi:outer membrane protein TolC